MSSSRAVSQYGNLNYRMPLAPKSVYEHVVHWRSVGVESAYGGESVE